MLSADWSDGVRWGPIGSQLGPIGSQLGPMGSDWVPIGSDWVISHTVRTHAHRHAPMLILCTKLYTSSQENTDLHQGESSLDSGP